MLHDLFTYAEHDAHTLTEAEEAETIAAAQAGDESAAERLLFAYGPVLRNAVARIHERLIEDGTLGADLEDLQASAVAALFEVIVSHDPSLNPRIAGRAYTAIRRALVDEVTSGASFAVPERTLSRYNGIVRAAEGDLEEAERQAPEFGMSREVFRDVRAAVETNRHDLNATGDEDEAPANYSPIYSPAPIVDVEDKILVDLAFRAVDDEEARIVELAYGFTEYDPVPDAEIAHRLGLTRPTAQRKRGKALDKMRKALGATPAV